MLKRMGSAPPPRPARPPNPSDRAPAIKMRFRALYLRQPWFLSFQFQEFVEALLDLSAEPPARTRRSYFSSLGVFAAEGDQHRGRRRSDVNQRKRLGSPNSGQRQYERERMMRRRAMRTNHQGQRRHPFRINRP